jgi:hypothetical protein
MMPSIAVAEESGAQEARKSWPHDLVLGILPLLIGIEILLWTAYLPLGLRGFADFRQLYTGGYMLRTGHGGELYDYDSQQRFQEYLVPVGGHLPLVISHLAYEELLFVPLSMLRYRIAYFGFMALNFALLIFCAELLRRRFGVLSDRWKWLPAFLLLAFFPISRTLQNGQDSILILSLLLAAQWALDCDKQFTAGLLVGIGIFKFQIVIPIAILFLIWRRWRFLEGVAASSAAAGLVTLWLIGIGGVRGYFQILLSMSLRLYSAADMRRYTIDPREMLNLRGLISAMFGGFLPPMYVHLLVAACSLFVLAAAARRRPSMTLAVAAASLVSYHFIVHDASILIIPIAAGFCSESAWTGASAVLLLIAPFCAIVPAYGYLAAIPLLGLFLLMLREHGPSELDAPGSQTAFAEASPCP